MAQTQIPTTITYQNLASQLNAMLGELYGLIPNLQPYATTAQVTSAISAAVSGVVGAAPTNLNDLGKVATAIQALQTLLNNAVDNDNFVNSFQDVLTLLQNFAEGTDLAGVIADKVGSTAFNTAITNLQNSLSNYVTSAALTTALNGYVPKSGTKVLSTNDYTDADKYTVSSIYKLGNAVASAATVDLTNIAGDYAHITGSVNIAAFSTLPAGQEKTFIFDGTPILTNSANLILPNGVSLQVSAGDTGTFRSEGGGVWRLLYFQAAGSYVDFNPNWTGFSAVPAAPGAAKYKFLSPNSIHVLICFDGTPGVSNATTTTFQLPYNATSSMFIIAPCSILSGAAYSTGTLRTRKGSNIVDIFAGGINTAWAASGNKNIFINNIFMIE